LFYQTYAERLPEIRHKACDELFQADINRYAERLPEIRHKACDELFQADINRPLFMQR